MLTESILCMLHIGMYGILVKYLNIKYDLFPYTLTVFVQSLIQLRKNILLKVQGGIVQILFYSVQL